MTRSTAGRRLLRPRHGELCHGPAGCDRRSWPRDRQPGADIGTDTLIEIENLTGGAGDDSLTGDFEKNILTGGAGADTLFGDEGDDRLIGGAGNDNIDGGNHGTVFR